MILANSALCPGIQMHPLGTCALCVATVLKSVLTEDRVLRVLLGRFLQEQTGLFAHHVRMASNLLMMQARV